jgi:acyl carrier protein phosphodiesterase
VNYLAHAYLSFDHPEILTGNMISDFVKGKKKFEYPLLIQAGIGLHRAIDTFTDTHPVTREARMIFKPFYGLYSFPLMDVIYDHFLATNAFDNKTLLAFSSRAYSMLDNFTNIFPSRFQVIYPYMKQHNWLFNYQHRRGIARSLEGLVRRSAYLTESDTAFKLFEEHYEALQSFYVEFFPSLMKFATETFKEYTRLPIG